MGQKDPYGTNGSYFWDKGRIFIGQKDPMGQGDPCVTKGSLGDKWILMGPGPKLGPQASDPSVQSFFGIPEESYTVANSHHNDAI